ncbi:MAG: glycosyltransferase, partial [Phycisphaerales bacterium]|nr:glycosyltransferase [Phycisphaerales bacterium]
IYPGAITINRGLEILIDSAAHFDNAVAVIMGYARNKVYHEELIERARERGVLNRTLFFREAVPIDKVVEYVASADLGVVPTQNVCLSYFYESSNKIFHCMMAGVPLAMSDHAEKRQLVEDHGIGVLFDETDPVAIAASINGILADQAQYDAMSQNCLDAARTMNWEHEEHKLRTMFARLIGDQLPPVPPVTPHTAVPDIVTLRRMPGIPAS